MQINWDRIDFAAWLRDNDVELSEQTDAELEDAFTDVTVKEAMYKQVVWLLDGTEVGE